MSHVSRTTPSSHLPAPPLPTAGRRWALFLDVDGTLLDFQDDPAAVAADASLQALLHDLHDALDEPIQRLAIAMEPSTYFRPHLHHHTWELLTSLRGRHIVLTFDAAGVVTDRCVLGEDTSVVETPLGVHHTVLSLDHGAVIFEVKHGPYRPFVEADYAAWSAPAGTPEAAAFMEWVKTAKVGERWAA